MISLSPILVMFEFLYNLQFTIYLLILRQNEPTWLSLDARIHLKIMLLINMLQLIAWMAYILVEDVEHQEEVHLQCLFEGH